MMVSTTRTTLSWRRILTAALIVSAFTTLSFLLRATACGRSIFMSFCCSSSRLYRLRLAGCTRVPIAGCPYLVLVKSRGATGPHILCDRRGGVYCVTLGCPANYPSARTVEISSDGSFFCSDWNRQRYSDLACRSSVSCGCKEWTDILLDDSVHVWRQLRLSTCHRGWLKTCSSIPVLRRCA